MSQAVATARDDLDDSTELLRVAIDRITPDPSQPRRHFDADALAELAASIREHGLIQPVTVKPKLGITAMGEGDYDYMIVDGERRWRAARLAGRSVIPCVVREDLTTRPDTVSVLQLIANLQRADLTLWETAQGCRALVDAIGLERAAAKLGYSKPWVSQRANVAGLPDEIRDLIERGLLTDVETAHNLVALAEIDEIGADTVGAWVDDITNGHPPTREAVRHELREAREVHEAKAARERARQQRADDEADARAAKAADPNSPLFSDPDGDDEGDDEAPAKQTTKATTTTRAEAPHEHYRRLREAAWAELMPDCKKLARECRKALIDNLRLWAGDRPDGDHKFAITISSPTESNEAPAKPSGAKYGVIIDGGTADAGVLLEALDRTHKVSIGVAVTVEELRAIERVLGRSFRVHVPWGLSVHGTVLNAAAKRVHDAWEGKQKSDAQHEADLAAIANARAAAARQAEDDALVEQAAALKPSPSASATEGEGYTTAQIARFLAACTQRDSKSRTKSADLHAAYAAWCKRHHEGTPIGLRDNRWGQGIAAAGIEKKRSDGYVYIGIKLLIEGECA